MVVKLIMVKVKIISVVQVRIVRSLRLLRLETPRKNAATKAFQRLISSGRLWTCPTLEQDHLLLEAEKNDQRHHKGEPDNEKS